MKRDLVVECEYPEPMELVWRAITEPEILKQWLMDNNFSAVSGTRCQFRMPPRPGFSGVIECEVLRVDAPRCLVYTWDSGGSWGRTTLTWTLEPHGGGTRLRLEHAGFEGFRPFLLSLMMGSGWKSKLRGAVAATLARMAAAGGN